jgi:hypothetical protein
MSHRDTRFGIVATRIGPLTSEDLVLARTALLVALAALAGCVGAEERSRDFTYLHATIIEPSCATANCHSAMTIAGPPGNPIDLSSPDIACEIFEGYGDDIVDILRGTPGIPYMSMPLDGPLPPADIAVVAQWLEEGASCE